MDGSVNAGECAVDGDVVVDASVLDSAAEEVLEAASLLFERDKDARGLWLKIGSALWRARDAHNSKAAFGGWIRERKIDQRPGLNSSASRSDAIWMAERDECAAKVDPALSHPRAVRQAWRILFDKSVGAQAELACGAGVDPESDLALKPYVDKVVDDTASTADEARSALIEAMAAAGGDAEDDEAEAALASLRKALKKAAMAGVEAKKVVEAAGEFWTDVAYMPGGATPSGLAAGLWAQVPDHLSLWTLIRGVAPSKDADAALALLRGMVGFAQKDGVEFADAAGVVSGVYLGEE